MKKPTALQPALFLAYAFLLFLAQKSTAQSKVTDGEAEARRTEILGLPNDDERMGQYLGLLDDLYFSKSKALLPMAMELDSLATAAGNDTTAILARGLAAKAHEVAGNVAVSLALASDALWAAQKLDYPRGIARAAEVLSYDYYLTGQPDSIEFYGEMAFRYFEKTGNRGGMGSATLNLANRYFGAGEYDRALPGFIRALEMFEQVGMEEKQAIACHNIAACFNYLKKHGDARRYLVQGMGLAQKNKRGDMEGNFLFLLATIQFEEEKIDSAIISARSAISFFEKTGSMQLPFAHSIMAAAFLEKGELEAGREALGKAFAAAKKIKLPQAYLAPLNSVKGELLKQEGKFSEALPYMEATLEYAKAADDVEQTMDANHALADLLEKMGEPGRALPFYKKYKELEGEIFAVEKEKKVKEIELKYKRDASVRIAKAETLAEQAKLKTTRILLFSAVGGLAAVLFFLFLLSKTNRRLKTERDLNASLKTEAYHSTKNHLAELASIMRVQGRRLKNMEAKELFRENEGRVAAIQKIHQKLLVSEGGRPSVPLDGYLPDLAKNILHLYDDESSPRVQLSTHVEALSVNQKTATAFGLVANELLTNACKHAFPPNHKRPEIGLEVKTENGHLHMCIRDNGKGLPDAHEAKGASFGLELVHLFLENINAKMTVKNEGGARFDITAPV